jgi:hypothetical protein
MRFPRERLFLVDGLRSAILPDVIVIPSGARDLKGSPAKIAAGRRV